MVMIMGAGICDGDSVGMEMVLVVLVRTRVLMLVSARWVVMGRQPCW